MPICKFFLQGNCRFGNNCRNQHTRPQGQGYTSGKSPVAQGKFKSPLLRHESSEAEQNSAPANNPFGRSNNNSFNQQSNFNRNNQTQNNWQRPSNPFAVLSEDSRMSSGASGDNDKIIEGIQKDVKEWAESKMWPYSAYSCKLKDVIPEGFLIEDLPDISPEELHLIFRLHGKDSYIDIIDEVDCTYSRRKDELFMMSESTKTSICSQIRSNQQNAPSSSLKLAALYNKDVSQLQQSASEQKIDTTAAANIEIAQQTSLQPSSNIQPTPIQSSSVFGSQPLQVSTTQSSNVKSSQLNKIYTPVEELTEDELNAYKAPSFTLYQIPERPPPKQLC